MTSVTHRFADVEVDTEVQEIRVAGNIVPVEPQVFSVLVHLIEHRERVVPKEELLDEVWGSRFISAAAITSRIKSARKAVGDTGRDQHTIRTVHGRGYRFIADLVGVDDDAPVAPPPERRGDRSDAEPDDPGGIRTDRTLDETWPITGRDDELSTVLTAFERGRIGGVLLTGQAGLGKTRLARAVLEAATAAGHPTARINGHASAKDVPLAAVAHLLPTDVTDVAGYQGDLARTALFQRARRAVEALADGRRLVLMVDDVERVDTLSQALIGSLISGGSVFAVMTQRLDGDELIAMDHLVRSGDVIDVPLPPVADDQLTALLSRVLGGPVQPSTTEALVAAARGVPGVLRQLVEASVDARQLVNNRGVWRLTGRITTPNDMGAAITDRLDRLQPEQRDALELVALAGDLDLDVAFSLIDDEVLDQLELEGMISVREVGTSARLRVSHPLFGEILGSRVTPLRDRRHRQRLAEALETSSPTSAADRLQLVQLRLGSDAEVDDALLIESGTLAVIEGDSGLAIRLLERVPAERRTARHAQLYGEALYMRGRFDQAGEVWEGIDLDDLDADDAAFVVRRIATWMFYGTWRHDEALAFLDHHIARFDGEARATLDSYWTTVAALDGRRPDEVIERADAGLADATGHRRVDYLEGAAMAHFTRGEYVAALERLEQCQAVIATLSRTLTWTGPAYAQFVEILTLTELGRAEAAWDAFDRYVGHGSPPPFGFVAIAAGRLALLTGRWQQVLDWLDPHIHICEALGITTNSRPLQASTGLAAIQLGDDERARQDADEMRHDYPAATNTTSLDMRWAVAGIDAVDGDRERVVDELLALAGHAGDHGNRYMESMLLAAATCAGGAPATHARLAELSLVVDGELAQLRAAAAAALAGDGAVAQVADGFDDLGLVWEATALRRAGELLA